jgi:hypothetical protein
VADHQQRAERGERYWPGRSPLLIRTHGASIYCARAASGSRRDHAAKVFSR